MAPTARGKPNNLPPIQVPDNAIDLGFEEIEKARLEQKRNRLFSCTKHELVEILRAKKLRVGGKKAELVDRLLGLEHVQLKNIGTSHAAKLLKKDIYEGKDLHSFDDGTTSLLDPEAVYHSRSHYREYPLEEFSELLESLRSNHAEQKRLAAEDDRLVIQQLEHVKGMATVDDRGFTCWRIHPGRKMLERDVADNLHAIMKPEQLRLMREEYWSLSKKEFRQRIAQEVLRVKQNNLNAINWNEDDDTGDEFSEWSESSGSNNEDWSFIMNLR